MTKQEKIIEAWGEHYETVKSYLDEDGWCIDKGHKLFDIHGIYDNHVDYDFVFSGEWELSRVECYRPKSLQGISTNNGWTKIGSEKDLPKKGVDVHVIFNCGVRCIFTNIGDEEYLTMKNRCSHYKIITDNSLPLY